MDVRVISWQDVSRFVTDEPACRTLAKVVMSVARLTRMSQASETPDVSNATTYHEIIKSDCTAIPSFSVMKTVSSKLLELTRALDKP